MTQMDTDEERIRKLNSITETIIGCAFKVGRTLGAGFLERVYENALVHELRKAGLKAEPQTRQTVWYDGVEVGEFSPDVLVEDQVIVEIKAARAIDEAFVAQCINYLAVTKLPVCLLLNFSKRVEVKRFAGPGFPSVHSSHLCPSVSSVASGPAPTPMTWAEQAEWDEP